MSQGQQQAIATDAAKAPVQDVVRAKRFELVDDAGKVRGEFRLVDGEPVLTLADAAGKPRGEFWLINGEPAVTLFDAAGEVSGLFSLFNGEPYLRLYDADGKTIWSAP